ncbi:MAG: glycosyltransferase family 2 protein [Bryobacterales bacterium]|nr:glycosyltransferase family 2 protein [Bryobacterales bacterium]
MKFSLILATIRRTFELDRLLESLSVQTHRDFELLVVGDSPHTPDYVAEYGSKLTIRYLGGAKGHSKALNWGLRQATGDVVAFPDDDCWYPPDLLARVDEQLRRHPEWSAVTGRSVTAEGEPSSGRWHRRAGYVSRINVWQRGVTITMFLRRSTVLGCVFDESLGVGAGTVWGAGEETDFLLQVLAKGGRIYYDPSLMVYHPEWGKGPYTPAVCDKARSYGRGVGRVLRKHHYRLPVVGYHLLRPLGGSILSWAALRPDKARYHWSIFSGRTAGWWHDEPPLTPCRELTPE